MEEEDHEVFFWLLCQMMMKKDVFDEKVSDQKKKRRRKKKKTMKTMKVIKKMWDVKRDEKENREDVKKRGHRLRSKYWVREECHRVEKERKLKTRKKRKTTEWLGGG